MTLDTPAGRALAHVGAHARGAPLDRTLRVTLTFHPDRTHHGSSVLESLAHDGRYRSQFETGTSNGGLGARPGEARWRWEQRMFGTAYDAAPASARPVYGALNHRRSRSGGALRFGSAHLRLAAHVLDRCTFCFPDSVLEPTSFGTAGAFDLLPLAEAFAAVPRTDAEEARDGGALDAYVEAHVHGGVRLATDVEALVLDPSFRGTQVERAADSLGVPVAWHEGRRLPVDVLAAHPGFRGARVVESGFRVAVDGLLDAAVLARAARTGHEDPQDLKRLWHCVARFGTPVEP
ncbi:uncharacterized protein DUF3626 [Sediminihabitans luteus]|uniref:Uncharacterized protein DUF3626 n=1 Tax=Sediminihabitans luteus TaxID=1138585 RepID=A0A2M9CQD6_9CELL|nr:DUF3626 domain-containing protein [Sediminihabitans luteus]PJJ74150.1 uncharacterized protein DUF3626 [Sediminihabitans luteus]GII99003.1 hypothetical protein Slu03_13810 [Sediminihabitans luteus]